MPLHGRLPPREGKAHGVRQDVSTAYIHHPQISLVDKASDQHGHVTVLDEVNRASRIVRVEGEGPQQLAQEHVQHIAAPARPLVDIPLDLAMRRESAMCLVQQQKGEGLEGDHAMNSLANFRQKLKFIRCQQVNWILYAQMISYIDDSFINCK